MTTPLSRRSALSALGGAAFSLAASAQSPKPRRINKAIELLAADQPIYYFTEGRGGSQGAFEEGLRLAKTWADFIIYEMEFGPFDPRALREFMGGLINGGPTASGHRTPAVQVVVPFSGLDAATVRANHWVVQQILAAGVHGVTLCHAQDPAAVREFVRCARYPHHRQGVDDDGESRPPRPTGYRSTRVVGTGAGRTAPRLDEGLRGNGGQGHASAVWGVSPAEYMRRADVWPLNPEGEVLIGLKLEDKYCLKNAAACAAVPGVGYAEWGPGDMGLSLGYPEIHDPPYPAEVEAARQTIRKACQSAGIAFLDVMTDANVEERISEGVRVVATRSEQAAARGRRLTNRPQPW